MALLRNSTLQVDTHFHDNDKDASIMSFKTRQTFETVNFVFVCTFISLFGVVTNTLNMVVFCKLGFQNTMTISFMALAISDTGCLITNIWFGVLMNPLLPGSEVGFVPKEIHSLTSGWPHLTFGRITGWITVYITAERCLCITAPLAVRNIVTPTKTTCSLFGIYFLNMIILVPQYATSYIQWKFFPDRNRSLLGLVKTAHSEGTEGLVFLLHAVLLLTSFVCVIVLTFVLVIKLKVASKWRRQATQGKDEAMSAKDKKATSMVVMISSLLIAMNSPGILLSLASFCEPKFSIFGIYQNFFSAIWSFAFICNSINSSVNIFMYYNMNSKYREAFKQLFLTRKA